MDAVGDGNCDDGNDEEAVRIMAFGRTYRMVVVVVGWLFRAPISLNLFD